MYTHMYIWNETKLIQKSGEKQKEKQAEIIGQDIV